MLGKIDTALFIVKLACFATGTLAKVLSKSFLSNSVLSLVSTLILFKIAKYLNYFLQYLQIFVLNL